MKATILQLSVLSICFFTTLTSQAQTEIEDNDFFGQATTLSSTGEITGTTDTDWQGDTWYLDLSAGDYTLNWIGDNSTRIRVIEYLDWFNPVTDDTDNTPGSTGDCTFENPYLGCFLVDNKENLGSTLEETFTITEGNHYIIFINPHMATELDYTFSISTTTTINQEAFAAETISIFPNPASDEITVYSEKQRDLTILDITGKPVFQTTISSYETKLSIAHLPKGMYIINSESNKIKFIKE